MNINSLPRVNKYNIIMYSTHFNFRSIHNFIYLGPRYCYLMCPGSKIHWYWIGFAHKFMAARAVPLGRL